MRFAILIAAGFFIVTPAMAQSTGTGSVHNFGSATCRQHVPCPDETRTPPSVYAAGGNACMSEGFGSSTPSGYFDSSAGLDGNSCLTYMPGSFPKGAGAQLIPVCCVVRSADNSCVFHCDLNDYE